MTLMTYPPNFIDEKFCVFIENNYLCKHDTRKYMNQDIDQGRDKEK